MMKARNVLFGFAAGLTVLASACAGQAALVSYWPLDGDGQAVVGTDGALVNGPTAAPDRFSTPDAALSFTGTASQYVSVPGGGGLDGLATATISMWVQWNGTQDSGWNNRDGAVLGRQKNGNWSDNVLCIYNTTDPDVSHINWETRVNAGMSSGVIPGSGTWRHVTVAISPTGESFYVDGSLKATRSAVGGFHSDATIPLTIGAWIGDGASYSTAVIDDVAVWDQKLSAGEVRLLANGGVSPADWIPSQAYERVVNANNPFAYYRFDGDSGTSGSQLTDFSGNDRHGAYQNNNVPIEVNSPLLLGSEAAHFDTSNNRAAGTTEQPSDAVTVEAWAKSDTPLWNNTGMLVSKRDAFIIHPNSGSMSIRFYIHSGGWNSINFDLDTIPDFDLQDWHQYVGVYDPTAPAGENLQFYVDGILRTAGGTLTGAMTNSTQPVYIGFDNAGSRYFDGLIDEVAIYDYALSEGDIFRHFMAASYVPEPSTLAMLLGLGVVGLLGWRKRRRRG